MRKWSKPKQEKCKELYLQGMSITQVNKEVDMCISAIRRFLKKEGILRTISEAQIGKNNGMWKGNEVSYGALHDYIKCHIPKPSRCEECGKETVKLDLANISQKYQRDLSDWEWLCRRCHMLKDGRMFNLKYQKRENYNN